MPQLTVLIPCKDEVHNIRDCIESVRPLADEILVADSGSTDGTLEVLRGLPDVRVIEREYINSANFKNWAIPQATHSWVLVCDADERPSEKLAGEIQELMASEPAQDGYRIRFRAYFLGYKLRFSGTQSANSVRLFRREVSQYSTLRVHADVEVSTGKTGFLEGRFRHYTCQCLNRFAQTQNRYSSWSASDLHERGRRVSWLGVVLRPPVRFLQFYLLRQGFRDGLAGFMSCCFTAYYTYLKYAKLWELQHSRTIECQHSPSEQDHRTQDLEAYRDRAA